MKYLILGATGTLGRATIKALLSEYYTESILCLSRDELKQHDLKIDFPDARVKCVLGDIRDRSSIEHHFAGIDSCFHFAALKRIPEMEAHPLESLKTNVQGTINAAECALSAGVTNFMFSSTDKACLPINTYGACKFLSEQILFNYNSRGRTNFSVYRWGNILGSRGSVVYAFRDTVENDRPAHITDEEMTRFWLKIEDAVQFVLSTYRDPSNEVRVPPMKSARVLDVLDAVGFAFKKQPTYEIVGLRPGEKIHEDILYRKGERLNSDGAEKYTKSELFDLVEAIR
jgi:UDP-N-acetylglucosamine 4,6-dehydratase